MSAAPKILLTLTCPACGGQVRCEEGESLVLCNYCDSVFALTSDEGANKIMYKLVLSKDAALAAVKSWMRQGPKADDLAVVAEITETYPMYLPYWRLVARGKAAVCGVEERTDDEGRTTRTPKENLINAEYAYSRIACDIGDLGVNAISVPEHAEAVSCDDTCDIVTFSVGSSRDDAFREGQEAIKNAVLRDGESGIDEVTFRKAFCFPKGFSLIYYPFWIVRYRYQQRDYFATVDGISGVIVSGRAPGSVGSQSLAAGIGGAVAGGIFGIVSGFDLILGGFSLILSGIILYFAWVRFRYGDEVITGELSGKGIKSGKTTSTVMQTNAESYNY